MLRRTAVRIARLAQYCSAGPRARAPGRATAQRAAAITGPRCCRSLRRAVQRPRAPDERRVPAEIASRGPIEKRPWFSGFPESTEPFSSPASNVLTEMANKPDEVLLQQFVNGDRAAFATLFRTFERDVYRWILRIVRDRSAAEDGVVEAFWRCHRSRAQFDPSRSFGAWMRRIATHVAIDVLNKGRRHPWIPFDSVAFSLTEAGSSSVAGRHALADAIVRAFDSLPTKLRVVATLALIEERPLAEIAEALGVPIGTVKSRLSRATDKLRKELDGLEVDT